MKITKLLFIILLLYHPPDSLYSQVECTRYWSSQNIPDYNLDLKLKKVPIDDIDTIYCDPYAYHNFSKDWYIDFFDKNIGPYFSKASNVNFSMFWYINKGDTIKREIHIVQFTLEKKSIESLQSIAQINYQNSFNNFKIPVLTFYSCVIKNINVYFICTETTGIEEKDLRFFKEVIKAFSQN
jgi:hypothetical protein